MGHYYYYFLTTHCSL